MPKKIQDSVVVITGASSGIGRATALEFASRGATVVLAARREQALREVEAECQHLNGGKTLVVPTDVTDENAVQELARRTVEHFRLIDIWVNNAGVGAYGRFEETPPEVFRQVVETNLFGEVYGARAVLPFFKVQGSGILINNASMLCQVGAPYYTAYAASKFAIRGFSESLREEIEILDGADIHICTVMPATIDTPFFQHAANYAGRAVKALPPVYSAEDVAKTIVRCAQKPQREVFVGNSARVQSFTHAIAPRLGEKTMARQVDKMHFQNDVPASPTNGNLFEPMQEGTEISGGWKANKGAELRVPTIATAGLATLASATFAWFWLRRR